MATTKINSNQLTDSTRLASKLIIATHDLLVAGARQLANIKTFDADGFTITWTKEGSPIGTENLVFLCFINL